ncbi:hypothetical protein BG846_00059 [Streptomyces fradiae ATCC 10745 = DSM 40063]|uniref:Uncharacterized protein n=1 Tax=Streptomyces fradiae ATCC 10745 = DSM 40063 TaxID=1319510 RepID=A0A1Y2P372_STRFR|nr:hypothetical protein BG846_00059 [Streptomyces fradiae ATCC 10745 = DSM 40063]
MAAIRPAPMSSMVSRSSRRQYSVGSSPPYIPGCEGIGGVRCRTPGIIGPKPRWNMGMPVTAAPP